MERLGEFCPSNSSSCSFHGLSSPQSPTWACGTSSQERPPPRKSWLLSTPWTTLSSTWLPARPQGSSSLVLPSARECQGGRGAPGCVLCPNREQSTPPRVELHTPRPLNSTAYKSLPADRRGLASPWQLETQRKSWERARWGKTSEGWQCAVGMTLPSSYLATTSAGKMGSACPGNGHTT